MLSSGIETALNQQINLEFESSYLYQSMASYFDKEGFSGFASWMKLQAKEELAHMEKIYSYVYDRGSSVILDAIQKPKHDWSSVLEVVKDAYKHEQYITKNIHSVLEAAIKESDHGTVHFLQWFVEEQVEEEAATRTILEKLEFVGGNHAAMIMMDREVGSRK